MATAMLQVRNLDAEVHAELKRRAKQAGLSLSDYVKQLLVDAVRKPTFAEWLADVRATLPRIPGDAAADVRALRDERS